MMENSEAFALVRPICVKLCSEVSVKNVTSLRNGIKQIENESLQTLQEYILFPLRYILKSTVTNEDLAIAVLECVGDIFTRTSLRSWELFVSLYTSVVSFVSHPKTTGQISKVSEELKISVVQCISVLISNADVCILRRVFGSQFMPALGHVIFVLLRLAESESNKCLRIKSLECLQILCVPTDKSRECSTVMSQTFASFLPGISGTLTKIITGSIVQGHRITVTALDVWADVVCLVMNDSNLSARSKAVVEDDSSRLPIVDRSDAWVEDTGMKLRVYVEKIAELVSHDDWRVRHGLAVWAGQVLNQCSKALVMCTGSLLDVLITLSADNRESVSLKSCEFIRLSAVRLQQSRPIADLVKENIHRLIGKLPRICHAADDESKLATLRLLVGYAQILAIMDNNLGGFLLTLHELNRLGHVLIQLFELDCSNVQLLAEKSASHCDQVLENDTSSKPVRKTFRHFQDPKIYTTLVSFCRLLGRYGDASLLVDHCLEIFRGSTASRNQSVMIMQEIITGAAGIKCGYENPGLLGIITAERPSKERMHVNKKLLRNLIKFLIEEYLEQSIWYSPFDCESKFFVGADDWRITKSRAVEVPHFQQLNRNVWLICLLLESIATFFKILDEEHDTLLMLVIYPLLEKMGSNSALVAHSAFYAADVISTSVGCGSIAEMIHKNSDYLVNALSSKLQHVECNPEAPRVLKVIFQNSDSAVLAITEDSVTQLLECLDSFHKLTSEPFVEVLNALVISIIQWFPPKNAKHMKEERAEKSVKEYFDEYHKLKQAAEGNFSDDIDCDKSDVNINDGNMTVDQSPPQALHVKLTVEILRRCVHALSRKSQNFCLLVLNTVENCIVALQDRTDDLLPLIHLVWSPFKLKFSDENLLVVKRAYETLLVVAKISGDFIRSRTLKDVWIHLLKFLDEKANVSHGNHSSAYTFTAVYKLQLRLLNTIGELTISLEIAGNDVDDLIVACLPYLSEEQPIHLQEAARLTLSTLTKVEPDIVWLHLGYVSEGLPSINPPFFEVQEKSSSFQELHNCDN